jgi:hypothetical protein
LREVGPQIKTAELLAESDLRMNCIANISECFQKACKVTINPNDPEGSYDLCLTRPEAIESLCRVQIAPCQAAEPTIMSFVKARLAGMRVDACTESVKQKLQSDNICGSDYTQCIGLDLDAIESMIHTDSLVSCQENGNKKSMTDIRDMIQGILLGIDDSMLTACQAAVESKMTEICGDVYNCDAAFQNDTQFGIDGMAINTDKADELHIIGLIDFSLLSNALKSTTTLVRSSSESTNEGNTTTIINTIKKWQLGNYTPTDGGTKYINVSQASANNVVSKINMIIGMLESDEKIKQCTQGRNMRQIRGAAANGGSNTTEARFPNLLDSYILAIVDSGLLVAKNNHDTKKSALLKEGINKVIEIQKTAQDISGGMCYNKQLMGDLDFMK